MVGIDIRRANPGIKFDGQPSKIKQENGRREKILFFSFLLFSCVILGACSGTVDVGAIDEEP
jgi:hypothetical protein